MSRPTTLDEQAILDAIQGTAKAITTDLRALQSVSDTDRVHPLSNSVFADIETLARSLSLLTQKAKRFYQED